MGIVCFSQGWTRRRHFTKEEPGLVLNGYGFGKASLAYGVRLGIALGVCAHKASLYPSSGSLLSVLSGSCMPCTVSAD